METTNKRIAYHVMYNYYVGAINTNGKDVAQKKFKKSPVCYFDKSFNEWMHTSYKDFVMLVARDLVDNTKGVFELTIAKNGCLGILEY